MPKLLYLTVWDFKDADSNGICKKILAQKKALIQLGFEVDFAYTKNGEAHLECAGEDKILGKVPSSLNIMLGHLVFARYFKDKPYDAIYIRHCAVNPFYIHLLSTLKKNCPKLVVEFPTFPYDAELKGNLKMMIGRWMDKTFRGQLSKYVNRVVTYSEDKEILGIQTIKTINGVDFSTIPQAIKKTETEEINLIAVAMLAPWHGYDRVIAGLYEYYRNNPEKVVRFHIVGEGPELVSYKELVAKWKLTDYVVFHGSRTGDDLNAIYDKADIAVSSLGLHRIGLTSASPLKTREYGARGLVMIAEHAIDFLPQECSCVYIVSADETPISIDKVAEFYEKLVQNKSVDKIRKDIRIAAEKVADMTVTFEPIKKYFMED